MRAPSSSLQADRGGALAAPERALLDALPVPAFLADADGDTVFANARFRALAGGDAVPPGGRWLDLVHPDDRAEAAARWHAAILSGMPFEAEVRLHAEPDGYRRHLCRATPMRAAGPADAAERWITICTDVETRIAAPGPQQAGLDQAELAMIYRHARAAMAMIDCNNCFVRVNAKMAEINGLPAEAHVGRPVRAVLPLMADTLEAIYDRVRQSGAAVLNVEIVGETPAAPGVARRYLADYHPLRSDDGRIAGISAMVREITEHRRTELRLQASEERLRLAEEATGIGVWEQDIASGDTIWSDGMFLLYERDPALGSPHGNSFLDLLHPDDAAHLRIDRDRLHSGELIPDTFKAEFRVPLRDGGCRWITTRAKTIAGPDGRPARMIGVNIDISDRKAAERALADSEARFRAITDAMPQMVWSTGPDGRHDYHNARWYQFTGVPPGTTDGDGWNAIIHPDDRAEAQARWRHSLATGEAYEIEYRLRHNSGSYRWVLARALPVRNADGAIGRWMGTSTDIDEIVDTRRALADSRRQLEDARAELERRVLVRTAELQRTNLRLREEIVRREDVQAALAQSQKLEALGQLVSGIAHDFNNMIQAVAGGYALIERRLDDPRLIAIARQGSAAAYRGGQLVKQLLAFARRQVVAPQAVDLGRLMVEVEPLLQRSIGTGVTLAIAGLDTAPAVHVDPVLLETALINLAVNARDAMPDGGTLSIVARPSLAGEPHRPPELGDRRGVAIRVADTGTGMTPAVLQRVMEPFFTTKGVGKGTGLGLAMVHGFAYQSGGALRIESREGEGTAVTIFLLQADDVPPALVAAAEPVPELRGLAILLVDDDEAVRTVTAAALADRGHDVREADGVDSALAAAAAATFDIVITDVMMPGTDGLALAAQLRQRQPQLPILFVTGHADRERLRGEHVLDKPFGPDDLARALATVFVGRAADPDDVVARLQRRIRAAGLQAALALWLAARGRDGKAGFAGFDRDAFRAHCAVSIIEVGAGHMPLRFRVTDVDPQLPAAGTPRDGHDLLVTGDETPGSQEAAYRRCVRTGKPVYEQASFGLGEGPPDAFERLVLPWTSDGQTIDRLVSCVIFDAGVQSRGEQRHDEAGERRRQQDETAGL